MQPNEQPQAPQQVPQVPEVQPVAPPVVPAVTPTPAPTPEPVFVEPQQPEALPEQPSVQPAQPLELPQTQPIQWQSPEYISHPKPPIWFVGFWLGVIVLMLIAALLVKSWSFTILVPVMAVALMIYSHRPPRVLNYVLSAKGLYINDILHPMGEFRIFGIIQDEVVPALMLIPVKRFRPGLTVYFPQENGEQIVDLLGSRIPMEDLKLDAFDRIIRKLRI